MLSRFLDLRGVSQSVIMEWRGYGDVGWELEVEVPVGMRASETSRVMRRRGERKRVTDWRTR